MWVKYPNQPIICFQCKETGHVAEDCPGPEPKPADGNRDAEPSNEVENTVAEAVINVRTMIDEFEPEDRSLPVKRTSSQSGLTPMAKKSLVMKDETELSKTIDIENRADIPVRRALDSTLPEGVVPPRSTGLKECNQCKRALVKGRNKSGLTVARCVCNDLTRAAVYMKCVQKDCREWALFPKPRERVNCSCNSTLYVCKCEHLHTANGPFYRCTDCEEAADLTINECLNV